MHSAPLVAPSPVPALPTAIIVADDPETRHRAAALLGGAGFALPRQLIVLLSRAAGPERIEAIQEAAGRAPVVAAMPSDASIRLLRQALRAGADGLVLDSELDHALASTVRAVADGQLAVPRALRGQLDPRPLSFREKQILGLVALGHTNRQIADELFVAESTVKTHLASAFEKLGAHSRTEAAALVLDPDLAA